MLKYFRSVRGQAVSAEYAVALMLAVAAVVAMSVYVRRTFQAKVRDAQRLAIAQAQESVDINKQRIAMEYEPYYQVTETSTNSYQEDRTHIAAGGVFNKTIDLERGMTSVSDQLSPKQVE